MPVDRGQLFGRRASSCAATRARQAVPHRMIATSKPALGRLRRSLRGRVHGHPGRHRPGRLRLQPLRCLRQRRPDLGRPVHHCCSVGDGGDGDRVRDRAGRQALPVGCRRARCIRLLRPGFRGLRRRRRLDRADHVRLAPRRAADPADRDPARRPAVLRRRRRHPREPWPRRDVPRRRPDHPGAAARPGRADRPARPVRGGRRHPPVRAGARQLTSPSPQRNRLP